MAIMIMCIVILIGCAKDVIETDLETDCYAITKKVVDHWDWRLYDEFDSLIDSGKDFKIAQMYWVTKECSFTRNFTTSNQIIDTIKVKRYTIDNDSGDTLSYYYCINNETFSWNNEMPKGMELFEKKYSMNNVEYVIKSVWNSGVSDTTIVTEKTYWRDDDKYFEVSDKYGRTLLVEKYFSRTSEMLMNEYFYVNNRLSWYSVYYGVDNYQINTCKQ